MKMWGQFFIGENLKNFAVHLVPIVFYWAKFSGYNKLVFSRSLSKMPEITEMTVYKIAYEWVCPLCNHWHTEKTSSINFKIPDSMVCKGCNARTEVNRVKVLGNIIEIIS